MVQGVLMKNIAALCCLVNPADTLNALNSVKDFKSPGLDGFQALFN